MDTAATRRWLPLPEYQPSTSSVICSGKSGWVIPSEFTTCRTPPPSLPRGRRASSSFVCVCVFMSPRRLWSQSLPPAGTLPGTRGRGRRALSTTATCSTRTTRPTTRSRCTRRILTRRKLNLGPLASEMPWVQFPSEVFVGCYYGSSDAYCVSCGGWLSETLVHFCSQQDREGHIPCIDLWVIAAPPPLTWVCCLFFHVEIIEITMTGGLMTYWPLTVQSSAGGGGVMGLEFSCCFLSFR